MRGVRSCHTICSLSLETGTPVSPDLIGEHGKHFLGWQKHRPHPHRNKRGEDQDRSEASSKYQPVYLLGLSKLLVEALKTVDKGDNRQ